MTIQRNKNSNKKTYTLLTIIAIVLAVAKLTSSYNNTYREKNGNHENKSNDQINYKTKKSSFPSAKNSNDETENGTSDLSVKNYLPSSTGEVVIHSYYTLSYTEKYEQAEWVCYELTQELLRRPNVPRSDWFNPDPLVSTKSVNHFDYKGSGFTRGHLVPAGDMSFDHTAMEETFYMSNMSPQLRAFNNGVWKELEEQTRDWTYQNKDVIIVSGPIIGENTKYFKKKSIAIPEAFYKIILDVSLPDIKAIAFIIPHEMSTKPLSQYAVSIDKVEEITGIDFFKQYLPNIIEKIESSFEISKWPISDARYKLRVEKWNYE